MNKREKQEKIDILVEAMEIYDREKQIQKQWQLTINEKQKK